MPAVLISMLTLHFLPSSENVFVLFRACCSRARVFGKTLLHEFHISCTHTGRVYTLHIRVCMSRWYLFWSTIRLPKPRYKHSNLMEYQWVCMYYCIILIDMSLSASPRGVKLYLVNVPVWQCRGWEKGYELSLYPFCSLWSLLCCVRVKITRVVVNDDPTL